MMRYLQIKFPCIILYCLFWISYNQSMEKLSCLKEDKKIESMMSWYADNGGYLHPNLKYSDGGMHVNAGNIRAGEVLASVPIELIFNPFKHENLSGEWEDLLLARSLIDQREDPSSFFYPYLSWLPRQCQNPICWEEEYNFSLHSLAFGTYLRQKREEFCGKNYNPTLLIAISVVQSRRFGGGLIPILDLFNHDSVKGEPMGQLDNSHVGIVAKVDYKQKEEVFNNYFGGKGGIESVGSATMLCLYGFLPDDVTHDKCDDAIHIRHPNHDKIWRKECIQDLKLTVSEEILLGEIAIANQVGDTAWAEALPILSP